MIEIENKKRCSGCSACFSICPQKCIRMEEDEEGFLYPQIDKDKCVDCNLCVEVCPIINPVVETNSIQKGYLLQIKDDVIRNESTSGGAFTAIANYVLKRGGVVFGAAFDPDFSVHHRYVEDYEGLKLFRNSKYVQSAMGDSFEQVKKFLEDNRWVCFSGTPCQVEGLLNYLGRDYDNLITVDIVCRAVPSPLLFKKYIDYQGEYIGRIKAIRFRDKHYGYKYSTMNIVTSTNRGDYHLGIESDPWLRAFFSGIMNRPSCYECQFRKTHRRSDFTIWDCLDIGIYSKYLDDDKGTTRVLIHSLKGQCCFESIRFETNYVGLSPTVLVRGSKEMHESPAQHIYREAFFCDANNMDGVALFEKWFPISKNALIKHGLRMMAYRMGIYKAIKKMFFLVSNRIYLR